MYLILSPVGAAWVHHGYRVLVVVLAFKFCFFLPNVDTVQPATPFLSLVVMHGMVFLFSMGFFSYCLMHDNIK